MIVNAARARGWKEPTGAVSSTYVKSTVIRRLLTCVIAGAAVGLVAAPAGLAAPTGSTLLISRPDGTGPVPPAADNASGGALAVSVDGRYVAFVSDADGFASVADPRVANVFLRDTSTGTTTLVSRSDGRDGVGLNASSGVESGAKLGVAVEPGAAAPDPPHDQPHVLVVFTSTATNVVEHGSQSITPTRGVAEVWMRDVTAGTTYLISRANGADGAPGDKASGSPSIAEGAHGPLVAFDSLADNLGGSALRSVFLRDVGAAETELVSCPNRDCSTPGPSSSNASFHPSIQFVNGPQVTQCPSGQQCALVAFETGDPTITREQGQAHGQIVLATAFVGTGATSPFAIFAVVSSAGPNTGPASLGNDSSEDPTLSADGEVVVYLSQASNLVFPLIARGAGTQAYATVMTSAPTGVTGLASGTVEHPTGASDVSVGGAPGQIRIAYSTASPNLGVPDPFGFPRAYVEGLVPSADPPKLLDRASGPGGAPGDDTSSGPVVSADASTVVFSSRSHNLDAGGGIDFARVYARRITSDQLELVSRPDGTGAFLTGVRSSEITARAVSADGRYVAFESDSDNLASGEDNRFRGVFVRDTLTGTTTLVSRADGANGTAANEDSSLVGISDNGRRVLFNSEAGNLGADAAGVHAYVRDLDANTTVVMTRNNGPDGAIAFGTGLGLSGDGNRVVFDTTVPLDPDARDGVHLYVRDIAANDTILVDRRDGPRSMPVDGIPIAAAIDRDGRRVAWSSDERNAIIPTHIVVRLRDLAQNTTLLVSRASASGGDPTAGDPANADASLPEISGDGSVVAFASAASNLGVAVSRQEIWVRHLDTGKTELASRADGASGAPADADVIDPSFDGAGDKIAFVTPATNLGTTAPSSFDAQSYVRDLPSQATAIVSRADGADGAEADRPGFTTVSLSDNGQCAAFSAASLGISDGFASADFRAVHMRVLSGECPTDAPDTTITDGPPARTTSRTAMFRFSSNEPAATFQCSLDAAPFAACLTPDTTGPLADGGHTFAVRAVDPIGNVDPTPAERSFAVARPGSPAAVSLSGLTLRPARFHVGGRRGGTTIRFRLTAPESVTLRFERLTSGRRAGKRCTTRVHNGKRCTIVQRAGALTLSRTVAGENAIKFSGRIRGRSLAPGRYRVIATPHHGRPRTEDFTVVRPPLGKRHRGQA